MDIDLVCNFKKCRKTLSTFAWVTSCSHIFCDEDGTKEFNKSYSCPACERSLSGKFDIIRIDLQPSDQYKSMVLAGQKPETIMEICSRAMAFWTFQSHQEKTYQEYLANKAKEHGVQLQQYYEQLITRTQTELNSLKSQLTATRKELDSSKKKYTEISDKMAERSRQYQKLQAMYDMLRRKCITPSTFEGDIDASHANITPARIQRNFDMPIATSDEVFRTKYGGAGDLNRSRSHSPAERDFVLRPHATPILGGSSESLNSVKNRFNLEIGTPTYKQTARPR